MLDGTVGRWRQKHGPGKTRLFWLGMDVALV